LSFAQVNTYLNFLLERELLEVYTEKKKTIYQTTIKGKKYLENYREVNKLLRKKGEVKEESKVGTPLIEETLFSA